MPNREDPTLWWWWRLVVAEPWMSCPWRFLARWVLREREREVGFDRERERDGLNIGILV